MRLLPLLLLALLTGCGGGNPSPESDYQSSLVKRRWVAAGSQTYSLAGAKTADADAAAASAARLWNAPVSRWDFQQTQDSHAARVRIWFIPAGDLGDAWGRVSVKVDADGYVVSADIYVRDDLRGSELSWTLAHEWGHVVLGSGHSPHEPDTMARAFVASHFERTPALTSRDANTCARHYSAAPVVISRSAPDAALTTFTDICFGPEAHEGVSHD